MGCKPRWQRRYVWEESSMGVRTANVQDGNIGETLDELAGELNARMK